MCPHTGDASICLDCIVKQNHQRMLQNHQSLETGTQTQFPQLTWDPHQNDRFLNTFPPQDMEPTPMSAQPQDFSALRDLMLGKSLPPSNADESDIDYNKMLWAAHDEGILKYTGHPPRKIPVQTQVARPDQVWTVAEDATLIAAYYFSFTWAGILHFLPGRTEESCRARHERFYEERLQWIIAKGNQQQGTRDLDKAQIVETEVQEEQSPIIKGTPWTKEEDETLLTLHRSGKWISEISQHLKGRTPSSVNARLEVYPLQWVQHDSKATTSDQKFLAPSAGSNLTANSLPCHSLVLYAAAVAQQPKSRPLLLGRPERLEWTVDEDTHLIQMYRNNMSWEQIAKCLDPRSARKCRSRFYLWLTQDSPWNDEWKNQRLALSGTAATHSAHLAPSLVSKVQSFAPGHGLGADISYENPFAVPPDPNELPFVAPAMQSLAPGQISRPYTSYATLNAHRPATQFPPVPAAGIYQHPHHSPAQYCDPVPYRIPQQFGATTSTTPAVPQGYQTCPTEQGFHSMQSIPPQQLPRQHQHANVDCHTTQYSSQIPHGSFQQNAQLEIPSNSSEGPQGQTSHQRRTSKN